MTAERFPQPVPPVPTLGSGKVRLSVVIPAFNEEAVLDHCLFSLERQTFAGSFEVIVVDNGSTDQTAAIARRHGARVVPEPQRGPCFARQRGFSEAAGEFVVTTDADTVFAPTWLQRIDELATLRPDAVGVAGPCIYHDGPWWGRAWGSLLFGFVSAIAGLTGHVSYVTATNLAFRREAFDGYDTRLTQGGDELDVLRRLRRRGRILFIRDNPVFTSARRLQRGLLHSLVVSLCFDYLLGYWLNRIARRTVLGTARAYRPTDSRPPSLRLRKNAAEGAPEPAGGEAGLLPVGREPEKVPCPFGQADWENPTGSVPSVVGARDRDSFAGA